MLETLVILFLGSCICFLLFYAMMFGHDGALLAGGVATLAGLAGYRVGHSRRK